MKHGYKVVNSAIIEKEGYYMVGERKVNKSKKCQMLFESLIFCFQILDMFKKHWAYLGKYTRHFGI